MGSYSELKVENSKIKPEFIEQVKRDIAICKELSPDYLSCSSLAGMEEHPNFPILREKIGITGQYVFWHIESMEVQNDGTYYWEGDYKFYEVQLLVNYLKDKVTPGQLIQEGEMDATYVLGDK